MDTFAKNIEDHLEEAKSIRMGLCKEGPNLIYELQDQLGLSLRKLAKASGLSATYLSKINRGRETMSPRTYLKLSYLMRQKAR